MAMLAANLSRTYNSTLGRNIVDVTGLDRTFDIPLTWAVESLSGQASSGNASLSKSEGLAIFTALQEQLGLKLEPAKGPVEVLIIDHIEKPSAN